MQLSMVKISLILVSCLTKVYFQTIPKFLSLFLFFQLFWVERYEVLDMGNISTEYTDQLKASFQSVSTFSPDTIIQSDVRICELIITYQKLNISSFPRNKANNTKTFRKIPKTFEDHHTLPDIKPLRIFFSQRFSYYQQAFISVMFGK